MNLKTVSRRKSPQERELISYVEKLISVERALENLRVDLIAKKNFNIMDIFRGFDISKKSNISMSDFQRSLKNLDIEVNSEETELLYKKFDKDNTGFLR